MYSPKSAAPVAAVIISIQYYLAELGEWVLVTQGAVFVVTVPGIRRGVAGEPLAW